MTVDQLRAHFKVKNNSQLAKKISRGRSTITDWEKKGIPVSVQALIQIETNGALKANIPTAKAA